MVQAASRITVLHSTNNADGSLCLDIFRRSDTSIGFEEFRRDVEDPSGWFPIGGYINARYDSPEAAEAEAVQAVAWFTGIQIPD